MTGNEIRHAAEVYVGKAIDSDLALIGINEAIRKIGDMGLLYGEISLEEASAGQTYYLPNDLLHVYSVVDQHGQTYDGWSVLGSKITFKDSGNYTILARKLGKTMRSLDEEPDTHSAYHSAIVDYLRRFAIEAKAEEPNQKAMHYDRFEADVTKTFMFLRRKRQPRAVKVVR